MLDRAALPIAAPAAHAPASLPTETRTITAAVLGNAMEFFDFISYAYFAVYIGHAFFPARTEIASLLLSLATFGAGFLTRPIGALVIGAFADRAGRRPAMTLTIGLMALGSFMVAVIPPYSMIGVAAPVLVVIGRLVQGFSVGGEIGPSTSYLFEAAQSGRRGRNATWVGASQSMASLAAGLLGFGLAQVLSSEQLGLWGWRIPFALGILILPIGVHIRRTLPETLDKSVAHQTSRAVIGAAFRGHWDHMILVVLGIMGGTVLTYILAYLTTYSLTFLHLSASASMLPTLVSSVTAIAAAIVAGRLCDIWNYRLLAIIPRVLLAVTALPALAWVVASHSLLALLVLTAFWAILGAISSAAMYLQFFRAFPQAVLSTALSFAYAVSVTLFGGTTQYVCTWLIDATGDPVAPAYLLTATTLISTAALLLLRERRPP